MTDDLRFNADESLVREIDVLALACLDSTATAIQQLRLQQLICEDPVARCLYIRYMHDSMFLRHQAIAAFQSSSQTSEAGELQACDEYDMHESEMEPVVDPIGIKDLPEPGFQASSLGIPPARTSFFNALHGPISYLSSGWPVAYLIATVIFGIGAVIGSVTYVSPPVQVVRDFPALPFLGAKS